MIATTASSSADFPRRWLWPFVCLSAVVAVTSPVALALVFAALGYFAISSHSELSLAEVLFAFGAVLVALANMVHRYFVLPQKKSTFNRSQCWHPNSAWSPTIYSMGSDSIG